MRGFLAAIALAVSVSACSSSTSASAAVANVAGTWVGTLQYTHLFGGLSEKVTQAVTLGLKQNSATNAITGNWVTTSGTEPKNGTVTGTVTSNSYSGTFTFIAVETPTTGACTGSMTVSGSAGGTTITWTSPSVTGNCADSPTNITFTATHQ